MLNGTKLEKAQCGTIRTKLLKIGAVIRITVRKIWIDMNKNYPFQELYSVIKRNINKLTKNFMRDIKGST